MKAFYILILLSLVCFSQNSCKPTQIRISNKLILGTWSRPVEIEKEAPPVNADTIKITFLRSKAIYHPGCFRVTANFGDHISVKFLTNKINYRIEEDSLFLIFPSLYSNKQPPNIVKYGIIKIKSDSLIVQDTNHQIFFFNRSNH